MVSFCISILLWIDRQVLVIWRADGRRENREVAVWSPQENNVWDCEPNKTFSKFRESVFSDTHDLEQMVMPLGMFMSASWQKGKQRPVLMDSDFFNDCYVCYRL